MIKLCPAGRVGTPDGAFITGGDCLMDGGGTASYWYGELVSEKCDERRMQR
jgi:hypothetical protein